jgi:hypothetical protein
VLLPTVSNVHLSLRMTFLGIRNPKDGSSVADIRCILPFSAIPEVGDPLCPGADWSLTTIYGRLRRSGHSSTLL